MRISTPEKNRTYSNVLIFLEVNKGVNMTPEEKADEMMENLFHTNDLSTVRQALEEYYTKYGVEP